MEKEGKYSKILTIRIDPALLEELKKEVESKDMDLSEFVRGCLRTGMYLHEMNTALKSRRGDFFK
jgi:predicted HicB family RNase H-like nuclease